MSAGTCRVCGCTELSCAQCVVKTGEPCCWVDPETRDLCSACMPGVRLRERLDEMVAQGQCSQAEADESFKTMDELSDAELRGEVTPEQALQLVAQLALGQLAERRSVS